MKKIILIFTLVALFGCKEQTPVPPPVVDYNVTPNEFIGKSYVGYQGWFNTPDDGSGRNWKHWGRTSPLQATQMTVDMWPDTSEYPADGLKDSGFYLPSGQPAKLFSSFNAGVLNTHMRWMQEYHIDGLFLQWFVTDEFAYRLEVTKKVRKAAELYSREFSVMIDLSGGPSVPGCQTGPMMVDCLKARWMATVDAGIVDSPMYMKLNGLPLLTVWGFGFNHNSFFGAQDALDFADWLKSTAPEKYRASLMGGVSPAWRTAAGDANTGDLVKWQEFYAKLDVISPWAVGRHNDEVSAKSFVQYSVLPDIQFLSQRNQKYLPVIFPGFSWHNLLQGPQNQIPRRGGQYMWTQARELANLKIKSFYTAMFDEVDEGTAILKTAANADQAPTEFYSLLLNVDGFNLPSDWYLQVSNQISSSLKSPNLSGFSSTQLPISP